MNRNFKSNCQYFICYRSEKTPGTSFAFNLRTSTSKTPNLRARVFDFFKSGLEDLKNKCVSLGLSGQGNFWELSGEVLKRIEGNYNYIIEHKEKHNEYLKLQLFVAIHN